jgi:hypothetical protein
MERISSFFLMGYAQRSRTSFSNTCAKNFLSINMTWSLVFVLKLISTFIGQNKELFFMHACVEKGCSAALCIAHEKKT